MKTNEATECCPRFDPEPWDETQLVWRDKSFIRDRVTSVFHIPLNYGAVMTRNLEPIQAAGALASPRVILTDENSLWGADVYFEVTKDVPGREKVHISGTFLSKAFEGPFSSIKKWTGEMAEYAERKGKTVEKLYFFYTTCPACAKKYGKNYVVLLAKV